MDDQLIPFNSKTKLVQKQYETIAWCLSDSSLYDDVICLKIGPFHADST